jgi:hypothetical protein
MLLKMHRAGIGLAANTGANTIMLADGSDDGPSASAI